MEFLSSLRPYLPSGVTLVAAIVLLLVARLFFEKRMARVTEGRFRLQLITLGLSLAIIVLIIMILPMSEASRAQLLSLLGILLSAAIALSSTTLLGNIMAGIMLRTVRAFRAGDFIRCGEHFGRVSERGLFHVELQTEDRDLTTLPNIYLATNPMTVINKEGTIVSTTLSLGYDVPHTKIEALLIEAGDKAGLQEPFVQVLSLGDFSVTYRIAGLYEEVKQILTKRSELRAHVLDVLHGAGVEIVSPTFMNTRGVGKTRFIPVAKPKPTAMEPEEKAGPESVVFDKAEQAELVEDLRERHRLMGEELKNLQASLRDSKDESERGKLQSQIDWHKSQREWLERYLEREKERVDET
jgi:small-conductance mechanosensitive channel